MSTLLFLTDEDADISGWKRLKLGARSGNPSLVRSVTATEDGPSSGVTITRTSGGTVLKWLSDRLDGTDLTAAAWQFRIWAKESAAAANVALRFKLFQYTTAEAGTALLDDNNGTELGTTIADYGRTSGNATVTTMADGDRLALYVILDDATAVNMAAGQTITVSFNGQYPGAEGDSYIYSAADTLAVTAAIPTATDVRIRRYLRTSVASADYTTDLSAAEIVQCLEAALRIYSRDRPRWVTGQLSGDGSMTDFGLPRFWVAGFSSVREVEYPTGNNPRSVLEDFDWEILDSELGLQPTRLLRFYSAPSSGTDNLIVRYSAIHVHTDELDTVPYADLDALCWLAASIGADMLAAKMAGSSDATISSDSVNYRDGEQRYRSIAKQYMDLYLRHIGAGGAGADGSSVAAAGRLVDWDLPDERYRLFKTRRYR